MGCCGSKKIQFKSGGVKAQPVPKIMPQIQRSLSGQRCPKCSWPMSGLSRYDANSRTRIITWVCTNRNCRYRR
jgi:hypothetical protein